jgi:hypothetical protein
MATSLVSGMTFQHHLLWAAIPLGLALREGWESGETGRLVTAFWIPYLLIGLLDAWNPPLRNLTRDLPTTWRDILWSVIPAAVALGAVWLGAISSCRAVGKSEDPSS